MISLILSVVLLIISVPILVLLGECLSAIKSPVGDPDQGLNNSSINQPQIATAVLIPAHNEASCIQETLETILPELKANDRLLVVADNCTDNTAEIARQMGALVIERENTELRGKGYALDYGLRYLQNNPPDVVVLMDADCRCESGAIEQIVQQAHLRQKPIQAIYLMEKPASYTPKDTISTLAFLVKNLVRPLGLYNLKMPCLLTGTGMAFPWSIVPHIYLATGNIVEDMQLGLDLAIVGYSPHLCPTARVTGILPKQSTAAKSQRTRWEQGHLQTLLTQTTRVLKEAIKQQRLDLLALALELSVPPLSFLVMLWLIISVLMAICSVWVVSFWLIAIVLGQGILLTLSLMIAWQKFAKEEIPSQALLAIPVYLFWKIPLYLSFLVKPQTQWVKTERD